MALFLHQLLVGAGLDDPASLHHHQPVGVAQGGEPVGDGKGGAPLHQMGQGLLDVFLGLYIDRGGGLVEDEDTRVVQHGPRNGHPLALPARKPAALLPHLGIVAVGLGHDEVVGIGRPGCSHDVGQAGPGPAIADIGGDGAAKKERLLGHDADLPAQIAQLDLAYIHPVDLDHPLVGVVETGQQADGGSFTHPGLAHQADHLARLHVEVEVIEHRLALVVAEAHLAQGHPPFDERHGHRIGVFVRLGRGVEDLEDPLGAGKGPGHPGIDLAEPLYGSVEQPHIAVEGQQGADAQGTAQDLAAPKVPDDGHPHAADQVHGGEEDEPVAFGLHADPHQLVIALVEFGDLARLLGKGLDHPDAREHLVQAGRQVRPALAGLVEKAAHALPEEHAPGQEQRHRHQDVEGQLPAHIEQEAEDAHQHQAVEDQVGHTLDQEVLQHARILGHPRHQGAHLAFVVELQREHLQPAVEQAADVGGDPRPQPGGGPHMHPLADPTGHPHPDQAQYEKTQQCDIGL